jgi:hypothetical protein
MRRVSNNLLLEKFYAYAGSPAQNKYTGIYSASCPVCREGKSWLKKKRLFFYPETGSFYCFNCVKSWNSYTWLYEVAGMSKEEVASHVNSEEWTGDFSKREIFLEDFHKKNRKSYSLPHDAINLMSKQERDFYKSNLMFQTALDYIKDRKLDIAVNKSSSYYISFTDFTHKNRLCIPYYEDNKVVFFQTRSLDGSEPRYLNKIGSEKSLFGIERVDASLGYIFLFEGPIDASMVKNGVAVAGLALTELQKQQLYKFPFHKKIWILDNPKFDKAAKDNTLKLLERNNTVFNWKNIPYKDFNEWCTSEDLNGIDYNKIIESVF